MWIYKGAGHMSKIFCLTGKSGSGKDTVFNELIKRDIPLLKRVVTHTTRPMRAGETEGVEYHFTDEKTLAELEGSGNIIEKREYNTQKGLWIYFTCASEIDMSSGCDYIMIGTPDVAEKLFECFGEDVVVVIYLELDDRERLLRCINRESQQKCPDYSEVCRRYLADEADFKPERLKKYKQMHVVNSQRTIEENADDCAGVILKYR